MGVKKIILKLTVIIMCISSIQGQPSRNKDNQKLSNQYMKRKNVCHDNLCAASGYYQQTCTKLCLSRQCYKTVFDDEIIEAGTNLSSQQEKQFRECYLETAKQAEDV